MAASNSSIAVSHHFSPTAQSYPAIILQITSLVNSYMIWAGTSEAESEEGAALGISDTGRLAKDWSCAMPSGNPSTPPSGTALFRSATSEISLSMAQRLARRFKKQIFLSIDIPPAFGSMGQAELVALEVEKRTVAALKALEGEQSA